MSAPGRLSRRAERALFEKCGQVIFRTLVYFIAGVRAEKKEYKSYSLSAKVYASAEVMYDALTDVRDIMVRFAGAVGSRLPGTRCSAATPRRSGTPEHQRQARQRKGRSGASWTVQCQGRMRV